MLSVPTPVIREHTYSTTSGGQDYARISATSPVGIISDEEADEAIKMAGVSGTCEVKLVHHGVCNHVLDDVNVSDKELEEIFKMAEDDGAQSDVVFEQVCKMAYAAEMLLDTPDTTISESEIAEACCMLLSPDCPETNEAEI